MTAPARHLIGIDLGGTKIAGGLVDADSGRVLLRRTVATHPGRGGAAVLADVIALARDLRRQAAAQGLATQGLGLGLCEIVAPDGAIGSDHLIAWRDLDPRPVLAEFGPVQIEADVRAAARAEARHGAGQGVGHFYYLTVGTGISGALVQDGRPMPGARGAALVIANGPRHCTCPACGHHDRRILEDIAGGPGLAAQAGLPDAESVLARADDPAVARIIDQAADRLGDTVALIAGALDPALIVVGGGLGSAPGRYWTRLQQAIAAGLWDGLGRDLPIRQAALGPDAGLIGAAIGVLDQGPADRPHS